MIVRVLYGSALLFTPLLSLWYLFKDLRRAALMYFIVAILLFSIRYKIGIRIDTGLFFVAFLLAVVTLALRKAVKYGSKELKLFTILIKNVINYMKQFADVIVIMFASFYIPIIQNWDYYTFYMQAIYNPLFENVLPLFNNIMVILSSVTKNLDVPPRAVAFFFMTTFYFLLREIVGTYASKLLLLLPSIFTIFLHENLYLDLSSLTLLVLALSFLKDDGVNSPYVALSAVLLLFTKANVAVIGFAVIAVMMVYYLLRRSLVQLAVLVLSSLLAALYFLSNAWVYDAYNFEYIPLYAHLVERMRNSTLAQFWLRTVSGNPVNIPLTASMVSVLTNLASPVYSLYVPALLIFTIINLREHVKLLTFHKALIVIIILTFLTYSYGRMHININVYESIFVIRYYVPLILMIYIFALSMLKSYKIELFSKLNASVIMFFYLFIFLYKGWFMKEKILLAYNRFQIMEFSGLIIIVSIIATFIIDFSDKLLSRKKILVIVNICSMKRTIRYRRSIALSPGRAAAAVYCIAATAFTLVLLYPIFRLHWALGSMVLDTDTTCYFLIVNKFFPEFFSEYFVSYYENDEILGKILNVCPFIYSFGGIYSVDMYRSGVVLIRGGHFSYLPLILSDLKYLNESEYKNIIERYKFLEAFHMPKVLCIQIPTENHAEKTILTMIKFLKQNSPSFSSIINKLEADKPILETKFYKVYFIKMDN
jgi:hypothetical protein